MKSTVDTFSRLGIVIERYIRETGMSRAEFARRVGVTPERIRQLMVRPYPPSMRILAKIKEIIGFDEVTAMQIAMDTSLYKMPHNSNYALVCDKPRADKFFYDQVSKCLEQLQTVVTEMGKSIYELKNAVEKMRCADGSSNSAGTTTEPSAARRNKIRVVNRQ